MRKHAARAWELGRSTHLDGEKLPSTLHRWGNHHLGKARLAALLQNATVMSACIVFTGATCARSAHFHVSGLDYHDKVGSILQGTKSPLGADMAAYNLRLDQARGDGLIFDYGANIGIAAVAAYLINTVGREREGCVRVLALEPVPESYLFLRWNLLANGVPLISNRSRCGVLPLNMAASRTRGNVTLAVGYRSMNAVVEGVGYLAPEPHTAVRRYEVRSTTFEERLHEMLTMQSTPQHYPQTSQQPSLQYVDLLKLDCEGCEAEVYHELLSRPSLAGRIRAVTGELHGCLHRVRHGSGGTRTSTFLKQQCQRMARYFREHWNRTGGDALMLV
jgi:FkbM family methyltransferase